MKLQNQELLETGEKILTWENITTHGILLAVIIVLIFYCRWLHKENKFLRDKCFSFTEKFFTISTMLNERLNELKK